MAKELTKDQVIELRVNLENEVNEAQQALADGSYSIDLENMSNINALLKQIDRTYNWNIKNAALMKVKTKENIRSKARGSLPSNRILLGITNSILIMKIGTMGYFL